ncbi:unnamed protein product, partial [Brassica oleracea]
KCGGKSNSFSKCGWSFLGWSLRVPLAMSSKTLFWRTARTLKGRNAGGCS